MCTRPKDGWANWEPTYESYAAIIGRRLGMSVGYIEPILKSLNNLPIKAFAKIADMGDEGAYEFLLNFYPPSHVF